MVARRGAWVLFACLVALTCVYDHALFIVLCLFCSHCYGCTPRRVGAQTVSIKVLVSISIITTTITITTTICKDAHLQCGLQRYNTVARRGLLDSQTPRLSDS